MKTLVVVIGPTGVGKTELCLRVAEHYGTPIVNADSRQIFAELPIGTAAPTKEQQQRVQHFFVGTHHVDDYYSAAMYEHDAINTLNALFKTHDIVVLSGGSMMYVDAVCKGIDDIPTVDDRTRSLYKRRLNEEGLPALVAELKERDPQHWEIVDRNNPRRVVHALEICYMTGKTYSSFRTNTHKIRPFEILKIGMDRPREELYDRINKRVIDMIEKGLEKEARAMYPRKGLNALSTRWVTRRCSPILTVS